MKSDLTRREANKRLFDSIAVVLCMWFTNACDNFTNGRRHYEMHWAIPLLGMSGMLYLTISTFSQLRNGMGRKDLYINLFAMPFLGGIFVYILIPISLLYNLATFALLINIILAAATFLCLLYHLVKRSRMPETLE